MTFEEWRRKSGCSIRMIANTLSEPESVVLRWRNGEPIPKAVHKLFERYFGISPKQFEFEDQDD